MKRRKLILKNRTPEITPAAEKLLKDSKLDIKLRDIKGSGKRGKITVRDIQRLLRTGRE